MFNIISKSNNQKGSSMIEILAVLSTASIVIGGVSFNAGDFLSQARDAEKVANLKQMVNVLEMYYLDHDAYPSVAGDNRFENLVRQAGDYLNSTPNDKEKYDYQSFNSGEDYIIKAVLENSDNPVLNTDLDGQVQGIDCDDPVYCLKI